MSMSHAEAGAHVTICRGPEMEERRRDPMGVRWCFHCRRRAEFEWVAKAPVIDWDNEASIYAAMWGPITYSECSKCKAHDSELFPGWTRDA